MSSFARISPIHRAQTQDRHMQQLLHWDAQDGVCIPDLFAAD